MKIRIILENDWTGAQHDTIINDMVSPDGGYGAAYRERAGEDYAKYRAPEMFGDDSYTCLRTEYIRH